MFFEIVKKDPKSRARTGRITTPHSVVETPAYIVVATNGEIRTLEPEDIPGTKTQIVISNTYHLWRELGDEGLESYEGLHADMGWTGTIMTDSGGFQVFSLGASREHGVSKVSGKGESRARENLVRVTESGVYFMDPSAGSGQAQGEEYLDAELSMRIQEQLGADIIFAFDEPSSPLHDYEYTKKAMERTHRWAERSLGARNPDQRIFGIVQGGAFKDLREESAKVIGAMPFDGFGIGGAFGTSFGSTKRETIDELEWTVPLLPEDKPKHLLGIGKIEDLFYGVEAGIDLFDCVIPTREARHGAIWTERGRYDVTQGKYADDGEALYESCDCPVCADELVLRQDLHHLFKAKNLRAGRLATIHNVYFFNDLMEKIRNSIQEGRFTDFKKSYLSNLITSKFL